MWLIVGLGNPGSKYLLTRHNVGFMALDFMVKSLGVRNEDAKSEHDSTTLSFKWEEEKIMLAKPETYMNLSGEAIGALSRYYKIPVEKLIVIHDEVDLPFGRIQVKANGSSGGHNGIKSTIEHAGTQEFLRVRVGVGRSPIATVDTADWVLKNFSKEEQAQLPDILNRTVDAVETLVFEGPIKAMNLYNKKD